MKEVISKESVQMSSDLFLLNMINFGTASIEGPTLPTCDFDQTIGGWEMNYICFSASQYVVAGG